MSHLLRRRGLALIMALVILVTVLPVNDASAKSSKKSAPALRETAATLYLKGEYASGYQLQLDNVAEDAAVSYKTSDRKIAKVSKEGYITPVKKGVATITATVKQKSRTYKLSFECTVKKATLKFGTSAAKKASEDEAAEIQEGQTLKTGLRLNGEVVSVYSSGNKDGNVKAVLYSAKTGKRLATSKSAASNKYVTISENGRVTGLKHGKYYIEFISIPEGLSTRLYLTVRKAKKTVPTEVPTPEPTAEPTAVPTAVPDQPSGSEPAATPIPPAPYITPAPDYRVDFAFANGSAYDGAKLPDGAQYAAGTSLNTMPMPDMPGGIFMGWYYDADMKNPVTMNDTVNKNMTLYAGLINGTGAELVETPVYHTVTVEADKVKDFSFEIRGYASGCIESFVDIADATPVEYTVLNEKIIPVLEQGRSYAVTLRENDNAGVYFEVDGEAQKTTVVTLNIITEKADVMNLSLANDLIYIPSKDISDVTGEMFEGLFKAEAGALGNTVEGNRFSGSFKYSGSERLKAGDRVAIYAGTRPDLRNISTMGTDGDGEVVYITVTTVNGDIFGYKNAELDEVIRFSEVLPVSVGADKDNDAGNHSITVDADTFDYSDSKYAELGLNADTTVDEGDFILFYNNNYEDADLASYGKIVSVYADGNEYTVKYSDITEEEIIASMDMYAQKDEKIEMTDEQIAALESDIQKQAFASGFINEASEYLAALALETDGFKELSDDLDFDLDSYNIRLVDATVSGDTDDMSLMGSGAKATIKKTDVDVKIRKDQTLTHCNDRKGLTASLKLSVKIEVKSDKFEKGHLEIDIVAFFEEEVFVKLSTSSKTVWKKKWIFPYVADYDITANLDFGTYTSVGITATIKTVETPEKLELPEDLVWDVNPDDAKQDRKVAEKITDIGKQMKKLLESKSILGGSNQDANTATDELAKKYADFIKKSSDSWITIVEKEIFEFRGPIDPLHILEYSVKGNFVVKVNLYLTLGAAYSTGETKRYTYNFKLKAKKATTDVVSLEDKHSELEFYVFGTAGLKVGIELELAVGLISTALDSIGITAEVGGYVQLWGYFYLRYTENVDISGQKTVEKLYSGALYIEIGIYLEIHFKAQLFSSDKLTFEPTLFEHTWKLLSFGAERNVRDFELNNGSDGYAGTFTITGDQKLTLPQKTFSMKYLDLKEGSTGFVDYDDSSESKYKISLTNSYFTYDPATNKIAMTGPANMLRQETELKFTYKGDSLAFTSEPVSITFKIIWTNPSKDRYILPDSNGGTVLASIVAPMGARIDRPQDPVKPGYVFDGWYTDENLTEPFTFPETMPSLHECNGIRRIYAKWKPAKDTHYLICYYYENEQGLTTAHSYDDGYGETGTVPSINDLIKEIEGCVYDRSELSEITAGGYSQMKLYYRRDTWPVTFTYGSMKDGTEKTADVVVMAQNGSTVVVPELSVQGYHLSSYSSAGQLITDKKITANGPATYNAVWDPNTDTPYVCEKYLENSDGSDYELAESIQSFLTTGAQTLPNSVYRKNGLDYGKLNNSLTVNEPVRADGSTVIKFYYDRVVNTQTYTYGEFSSEERPDLNFDAKAGVLYSTPTFVVQGYVLKGFAKRGGTWTLDTNGSYTFFEPGIFDAVWEPARDTAYKVEHYVQQGDGTYQLTDTDDKMGETGTVPDIGAISRVYTMTGLNQSASVLVPVAADGSSVMKLYYDRTGYYITFTYGDFREETGDRADVTEVRQKGEQIDVSGFDFKVQGYVFDGFDSVENGIITVTGDAEYDAKWLPAGETKYTVQYWGEDPYGSYYDWIGDDECYGTTGETVTAEYRDFTEFVAYPEHEDTENSLEILADGSMTIKLYYKRKTVNLTFNANGGTLNDADSATYKIDQILQFKKPAREGYGFIGWSYRNADGQLVPYGKYASTDAELFATWTDTEATYEIWKYIEDSGTGAYGEPIRETRTAYLDEYMDMSDSPEYNSFADASYLSEYVFAGSNVNTEATREKLQNFDVEMFFKNPRVIQGMVINVYYKLPVNG